MLWMEMLEGLFWPHKTGGGASQSFVEILRVSEHILWYPTATVGDVMLSRNSTYNLFVTWTWMRCYLTGSDGECVDGHERYKYRPIVEAPW
jgi:hypothetical protein